MSDGDAYFDTFCKLEYKILIRSVIKGRHCSPSRMTLVDVLEISPESTNNIDSRAFQVKKHDSRAVYGHVPQALSVIFTNMDLFGKETRTDFKIYWYVL